MPPRMERNISMLKPLKFLRHALLASLMTLFLTIQPILPAAASPSAPQPQYTELYAFWDRYGVPTGAQRKLMEKLERGEIWDSLTSGAAHTTRTYRSDGERVVVSKFTDGSISVASVSDTALSEETPSTSVSPRGVSECSYSGGSYWYSYTNCKAEVNWGLFWMGFRFDYSGSYSSSSIGRHWGHFSGIVAPGGSVTNKFLEPYSANDVRAYGDFACVLFGQTTYSMGVTTSGRSAWTTEY